MDMSQYPSRFELSGVVLNVFQRPEGKGKDGASYGGEYVIQLMSADRLRNGDDRLVSTDLTIGREPSDKAEADKYKPLIGKAAKFPCTVYVGKERQLVVALARGKAVGNGSK